MYPEVDEYMVALTVPCEHCTFLCKHEHHVINRMSWGVEGCQGSTLDGEHLSLLDICLSGAGLVFEHLRLGTELEQIRKSIDMIAVPMCQKRLVHCCFFFREHGLKIGCP